MSRVYEAKLITTINKDSSPLLNDFLDKAVNSRIEPDEKYFTKFKLPELALLAFDFVRYSRAPEFIWSSPYTDYDKQAIANGWIEHCKQNSTDAVAISKIIGKEYSYVVNNKFAASDTLKLQAFIDQYPESSFEDDVFFFSTQYSSNDKFSFEQLVEFLNKNRDLEEKLYTAFLDEEAEMPEVKLYVDDEEITLFEGSSSIGLKKSIVCYDWNGYFCGEFEDRPVSTATLGYQYMPPVDMKYRINWLNEADVSALKTAFDFYERKPQFHHYQHHVSKKEQRQIDAKEKRSQQQREEFITNEKTRIKSLSNVDLLKEYQVSEGKLYSGLRNAHNSIYNLLKDEINGRGLEIEPRFVVDPKGDSYLFNRLKTFL